MAKKSEWVLKVYDLTDMGDAGDYEASPDNLDAVGKFRGELMFKGEIHWIVEASNKMDLEMEARDRLQIAKRLKGNDFDDVAEYITLDSEIDSDLD